MKCKFCDGSGKDYWGRNGEPYPCPVCNGTGEYEPFDADIELDKLDSEPQTNEEWLRKASTEELAWFIADVCYELQDDIWSNCEDTSCDYRQTDKDYWVGWLKQPYIPLKNDEK